MSFPQGGSSFSGGPFQRRLLLWVLLHQHRWPWANEWASDKEEIWVAPHIHCNPPLLTLTCTPFIWRDHLIWGQLLEHSGWLPLLLKKLREKDWTNAGPSQMQQQLHHNWWSLSLARDPFYIPCTLSQDLGHFQWLPWWGNTDFVPHGSEALGPMPFSDPCSWACQFTTETQEKTLVFAAGTQDTSPGC